MNYFATFPGFIIRPGEVLRNAFKRLASSKQWSDRARTEEKAKFHQCVAQELDNRFNKLEHYQQLCDNLFDTVPSTITQCKKLLTTKYVNIWDIFEGKYKYFEHYDEFRRYTKKGRTFNKTTAKGLMLN
ncbi:hypothetical protein BGZ98_005586, partial [Dissophora globulifera]